jgi:predicted dehydrogenase
MRRIRMGLVGAGFVGPHHIEAVRRLGFVDVVAIAGRQLETTRKKAEALNVPKAYGGYEELINDPEVEVVHNAAPNYLHLPITMAAIKRGKHVISDKPLAISADEARQLRDAAREAGVVNAVTFNYRGNPLVQQARVMIEKGEIGPVHFIHGYYLQDWLIKPSDYSWRLEPDKGGPTSAIGDIGSHWCDLVQYVSRRRIEGVLANLTTTIKKRLKPKRAREAFVAAAEKEEFEEVTITADDLAAVMVRFSDGCQGVFYVGQVCAGHKNDLVFEMNGSQGSLRWFQERPNELWIGRRDGSNSVLLKDPTLLDESIRRYAHLPGGHNEAWPDAFKNVLLNVYTFIAEGRDPRDADGIDFPTFEDGYRANCIAEAILESSRAGGVWMSVRY